MERRRVGVEEREMRGEVVEETGAVGLEGIEGLVEVELWW